MELYISPVRPVVSVPSSPSRHRRRCPLSVRASVRPVVVRPLSVLSCPVVADVRPVVHPRRPRAATGGAAETRRDHGRPHRPIPAHRILVVQGIESFNSSARTPEASLVWGTKLINENVTNGKKIFKFWMPLTVFFSKHCPVKNN